MNSKSDEVFDQLKNAAKRFEEALKQPKNEFIMDSAIQRFEFTAELLWKSLKTILEHRGRNAFSPKEIIRMAFKEGILNEDAEWIRMVDVRNTTSHIYNQLMAESVYNELPHFLNIINEVIKKIESGK